MKINYYDICPICGCCTRGISINDAECSNTNCESRRKNHGILSVKKIIDGKFCTICDKPLYEGINSGYCGNDECERYLREQ